MTLRNSLVCRVCNHHVGLGREAGPEGLRLELTKGPCDYCLEAARREREQLERLERLWRARECADPECVVVFEPRRAGQRFCCDAHRKRTHRRAKAAAAA